MKISKKLFTLICLTALSSTWSQGLDLTEIINDDATETTDTLNKDFEITAGYINDEFSDDSTSADATGLALSLGKIWGINESLSTTTSLQYNKTTLDGNDFGDTGLSDVGAYEIGISQKLTYDKETSWGMIRPYMGLSFAKGFLTMEGSAYDSSLGTIQAEIEMEYNKYTADFGLQLAFNNGLTPFINYSVGRRTFDKNADISVTMAGQTYTATESFEGSTDLDTSAVTLGLGYIF